MVSSLYCWPCFDMGRCESYSSQVIHRHIHTHNKCLDIHSVIGAMQGGEIEVVSGLYCILMTVNRKSRKTMRVAQGSAHVNTPVQVAVLVPVSISTVLLRTWKSTLARSKARENEIVSRSPKSSLRGESRLCGLDFHEVQANQQRGLIKAPIRHGGLTEIDGYVTANNRGTPQAVNIASLIWSKVGTAVGVAGVRWRDGGREEGF